MIVQDTSTFYRPNDSKISWELIDGEVIAIHYQTGHYFSLTGQAAQVWQYLAGGVALENLRLLAGADTPERITEFDAFLKKLEIGDLIERIPASGDVAASVETTAGTWQTLVVEEFADLEQLLLADPLHDVDDMGWPHLPPGQEDSVAA